MHNVSNIFSLTDCLGVSLKRISVLLRLVEFVALVLLGIRKAERTKKEVSY